MFLSFALCPTFKSFLSLSAILNQYFELKTNKKEVRMALCHKLSLLAVLIFVHILLLNKNQEYLSGFFEFFFFFLLVKFEFLAIVAQAIRS